MLDKATILDADGTPAPREVVAPRRHVPGVPRGLVSLAELSWRVLVCAAAIALVAYVLWYLRIVVLPIFVALLFATVLVPPAQVLRRRGVPAVVATALTFLAAALVLTLIGFIIVPPVVEELGVLGESVRAGIDELGATLASGPFGVTEMQVERAIDTAQERVQESGGTITSGILSGAVLLTEILAGILIALVLVFFFVKDGDGLWAWVVRQFPRRQREKVNRVGARSWEILTGYVRGLTLVAVVDAILIGIALLLIGVPLVLPLAVITFLAAFVPLVGAVTAGALAALVALVAQGYVAALLVVVAITIIQQIEGDLLHPLVVGKSVALHPVAILLAVSTGVIIAGIIGALVAVPLVAVLAAAIPIVRREADPDPLQGQLG